MSRLSKKAVIIGAGPAGLTAGLELFNSEKFHVQILYRSSGVGGISKTTEYKGCKFDIGPHHFITESDKVDKWWKDLMKPEEELGNKFVELRRFTRIYYKRHFFYYPLKALNVLTGLSFIECLKCLFSYMKIRLFPIKNVKTFKDWVTNKFGHRLFSIFFKTYTEKVWGMSCEKISADWAAVALQYTEDAIRFPPGGDPIKGRSNIQEGLEAVDKYTAFTTEMIEIDGHGDIAYGLAKFSATFVLVGSSEPMDASGMSMVILKKQANNTWKLFRVLWN